MARRSPRKRNGKIPLEESWALEDQLENDTVQQSSEKQPERESARETTSTSLEQRPRRRGERRRKIKTPAEPDLIMPWIQTDSTNNSWVEAQVRYNNPPPRTTRRTRAQQQYQMPEPSASESASSESAANSDSASASSESEDFVLEEDGELQTRTRGQRKLDEQNELEERARARGLDDDGVADSTTTQGSSRNRPTYTPLFGSNPWPTFGEIVDFSKDTERPTKKSTRTTKKNDPQFRPMKVDSTARQEAFSQFGDGPAKKPTSRPSQQFQRESEQSERRQRQQARDSPRKNSKDQASRRRREPERRQQQYDYVRYDSFGKPYHQAAHSGLSGAWSLISRIWGWFAPTVVSIATFLGTFAFLMVVISYVINWAASSVSTSLSGVFAPVCMIPGMSLLPLNICGPGGIGSPGKTPIEFDQMMDVQAKFEEVLDEQSVSFNLPLDMKRGETAIRDLRNIVKFSSIPSKNELVLEFDNFIETSRMAIYDLTKYNSHIGRAVDNVLATTRWTQRTLDDIGSREASKGRISSVAESLGMYLGRGPVLEQRVLDQYITHARTVEEEINRLIIEAQSLLRLLRNLEERLDTVHGIVTRDTGVTLSSREDLSRFWAKILGESKDVKALNHRLALLDHIGKYRKSAIVHVSHTLVRLQEIGAGLEDLRERVVAPEEAVGKMGADVPLSIHLESIESGVQRLEAGRSSARKVESEFYRKSIRGHEEGEAVYMMVEGAVGGEGGPGGPGVKGRLTAVPGVGRGPGGPTITRTTVVVT